MDNSFLDPSYKVPSTSDYMKFAEGANRFRVLTSAITGFEYWNTSGKSVRSKEPFVGALPDIRQEKDDEGNPRPGKPKHFWAFVVWNYEDQRVQVLQLTQKGIMDAMLALVKNPAWGDPKQYDIVITRTGSGLNSEYQTIPNPKSDMPTQP